MYEKEVKVELGAFSVSLAVKDIDVSKAFYEKLGFEVFGGDITQNWLILKNGDATIGLFQGMFEENILTFNPGWDRNAKPLEDFKDVREIQQSLKAFGMKLEAEADESTSGPASLMIVDPDGNPILIDQHV
jgi:catechol 2,3-dioxygenase-like lactoylglutathione lyase family enzyme